MSRKEPSGATTPLHGSAYRTVNPAGFLSQSGLTGTLATDGSFTGTVAQNVAVVGMIRFDHGFTSCV
jgi:hypothetical protein